MGNEQLQAGEVLEQIRVKALHEGCGVGVQIVRACRVEAVVATGADMDHSRNVVLHHFFVNGIPMLIAQRWGCPMPP